MQSRRGGTHRHTNRRHPQAQQHAQGNTPNLRHAPPEGHTPTPNGDVRSGAGGPESAPQSSKNHLRAPSRVPQPAQAGEDFPSASLNKGPPACGERLSLCVRPPGLRPAASRLRRPSLPSGSRSEGMVPAAPCGTSPLPPAVPTLPGPGAQHRASPSPLLPAHPVRRQTFPGRSRRPAAWPSRAPSEATRGWLLPAPTRLCRAAASSGSLTALSSRSSTTAAAAAAPCPPVTQETASSSVPPTNQHRSHGASQPMDNLAILVPFQGPEPFPKLVD